MKTLLFLILLGSGAAYGQDITYDAGNGMRVRTRVIGDSVYHESTLDSGRTWTIHRVKPRFAQSLAFPDSGYAAREAEVRNQQIEGIRAAGERLNNAINKALATISQHQKTSPPNKPKPAKKP